MKILILNGSPKGTDSVTLRYIYYIQKKFPQHEYEIVHISQKIKAIEKDNHTFDEIIKKVQEADGIIWSYPLYVLLVIAQYKRFIELIFERGAQDAFRDKYCIQLTTSIKFFDYTAHRYMEGICNDLGMKFVDTFSAAMHELKSPGCQKSLQLFAEKFFSSIKSGAETFVRYRKLPKSDFSYSPGEITEKLDSRGKKILVLTDSRDSESNISKMVQHFSALFSDAPTLVNIHDIDIKGGCLGCIQCGYDNTCVYTGKDGFIEFYRNVVQKHDIIVYAGEIVDRYFSSRWKYYFDRRFCETHTAVLPGTQQIYLVSGPLSELPHLQDIIEFSPQLQESNIAGIVSDEVEDSASIDKRLIEVAKDGLKFFDDGFVRPYTFLGVGGLKIFRDEMFAELRFPFLKDYKYYKKNGYFDFPQKKRKAILGANILYLFCKIPGFRKMVYTKEMKPGMVGLLDKVLKSM